MAIALVLRSSCDRCGSTSDLYGSNCKHLTLCFACGKAMATNRAKCNFCLIVVSRLIRVYNVKASAGTDKDLFIARFATGLPPFSKKKSAEDKWTLHMEGIQGRQLTDGLQEKSKNKAFVLEDETGQHQYRGQPMEGTQSATYYLLIMHGKGFVAAPACSWYNFNKIAQYRQLSCEEAEEKMDKRERNATGYGRWMMRTTTCADVFAGKKRKHVLNDDASDNNQPKKGESDHDDTHSGMSYEDVKEEVARKSRLASNKRSTDGDDDHVSEGDDTEIGDNWEHEEIFTDDDEAAGNGPEEREDLDLEVPAPPEIKLDDEDEDDKGLSTSGAELKKLLGRVAGLNESDVDADEDDNDVVQKQKYEIKDEPSDNSSSKPLSSASSQLTSTTKSSKVKRKLGNGHAMSNNGAPSKKLKTDNEITSVKDEPPSFSKSNVPLEAPTSVSSRTGLSPSIAPVTIDEIKASLSSSAPLTTQDVIAQFKGRLQSPEDKKSFADMLKMVSKIRKSNGHNYVVLK